MGINLPGTEIKFFRKSTAALLCSKPYITQNCGRNAFNFIAKAADDLMEMKARRDFAQSNWRRFMEIKIIIIKQKN